jgi:hypothetical protein
MKSVNTSNLKSGLVCKINEIIVVLPDNVIEKLEKLQAFRYTINKNYVEIGSAATASLCGYLILKLKEGVNCDICLSTLCDASPNKKSPLLKLIYNQDRGNLNYPNERFIKLVEFLVQIIQEILPYLPHQKSRLYFEQNFNFIPLYQPHFSM